MSAYHVGDTIPFQGTFTDDNGSLVDPVTVEAVIIRPDWTEVTIAALTRISQGLYEGSFDTTAGAGPYSVSVKCSGGYKGCEPETFQVFGAFG